MTNLEVLIGSLLPLARHGVWCGLGEHAHGSEDGQGGTKAGQDVEYDLLVLIGRRLGTGPVRTESNPVSYEAFASAAVGWSVFMTHRGLGRDRQGPIGRDRYPSNRLKLYEAPAGEVKSFREINDAVSGLRRCTHQPSSPGGSGRPSSPSCGRGEPSTAQPAPAEACPPISSRCWPE